MSRIFLFLVAFLTFATISSAQQLASADKIDMEVISLRNNKTNWSFYADEENKLYYLDFEMFNFNLKEIIVKNSANELVKEESVADLPVDTIYELDFSEFPEGEYKVEIHSFNGILSKKVTI